MVSARIQDGGGSVLLCHVRTFRGGERGKKTEGKRISKPRGLRDGTGVKSSKRSYRGPEFGSQPHGQLTVTCISPAPGDLVPFSGLLGHLGTHVHRRMHTRIK